MKMGKEEKDFIFTIFACVVISVIGQLLFM